MTYDSKYYDEKWKAIIPQMPKGGQYRFDLRQYGHNIVKDLIKPKSKVFDYACGLGVIDIQLYEEKECDVYGCDFSKVAVDYINKQLPFPAQFKVTDKIEGYYDYVLAIQFLEHIPNPCEWIDMALKAAPTVICVLPNNFRKSGEHVDMAWGSWEEFETIFSKYKVTRVDVGKYPPKLHNAFQHPVIKFESKVSKKKTSKKRKVKN